jgi:arylsulfatase A-like enzyme
MERVGVKRTSKARPASRGRSLVMLVCVLVFFQVLAASCGREGTRPNVLLIVVDALRPDHLSCYGYGRPTSPVIDTISDQGVLFENAISHAPWTKSSFSSMLTSRYPFQHGVVDWESVMPDTIPTLPEVLAKAGYSTGCVMNTVALSGEYQVLKGFESVVMTEKEDRDAFKTTEDVVRILDGMRRPFFLMVHYSDVHLPYRPPLKYIDLVRTKDDAGPYKKMSSHRESQGDVPAPDVIQSQELLYDGCIRLADDGVAKLIEYLRNEGILDKTLVIITADHGEAFWEHGAAFHAGSVYEEVIRVPLIMRYPPLLAGPRRVPDQVRHIDLLPTILEVTGAADWVDREGESLLPLATTGRRGRHAPKFLPEDATLCECTRPRAPATRCIRLDGWKLILESLTATTELYNLSEDPGETVNLSGRGFAVEDSLLGMIRRVPGTRIGGWRIALPGAGRSAQFRVTVSLPDGARFASVERFASRPKASLSIDEDSTTFHFEAKGQDLSPLLFSTRPADSPVQLNIESAGGAAAGQVHVGETGQREMGKELDLTAAQAMGLPAGFLEAETSGTPGAYIWWLPGERAAKRATVELTPEQKQRLRALGYIQ